MPRFKLKLFTQEEAVPADYDDDSSSNDSGDRFIPDSPGENKIKKDGIIAFLLKNVNHRDHQQNIKIIIQDNVTLTGPPFCLGGIQKIYSYSSFVYTPGLLYKFDFCAFLLCFCVNLYKMYRSDYYLSLSGDVKCRYNRKMEIIDNVDPYAIPVEECKLDLYKLPNITMMDLVNYLILSHSFYTGQQLKAYKSLQAYKQFEAGSVQGVLAKQFNDDAFVVIAKKHAPCLDKEELCTLLTKLQKTDIQPAICRLLEPFASQIAMANNVPQNLPPSLDNWYSSNMVSKSYEELLAISKTLDLTLTEDQCKAIEATTREQSQNSTWFKYRAGRITASRFKAVCRTTIQKPSLTVVKGVCYPQKYEKYYKDQHTNFMLSASGFIICQKHPEVAASPDGLVSCSCCGLGCVEVKCPYLLADATSFEDFASKKHTCLIFNENEYSLDRSHCYYYQMQCQMFVTQRKYCDFVIWSKHLLFVERIWYDNDFCLENIKKALDFHAYVIRPELLGRTSLKHLSTSTPAMTAQGQLAEPPSPKASKDPKVHTTSKARQKKFQRHFPNVEEDEKVLNHYSCALIGDILLQGHLYITKNYFAFYSNVFGYVTKLLIPILTVEEITKEKTARIIPNAVGITTSEDKHIFGSLMSRDSTLAYMRTVWEKAKSEEALPEPEITEEQDSSESGESGRESPPLESVPSGTDVLASAKFDRMRKESVRNQIEGSMLERKNSKGLVRTLKDAITEFRKLPRQSLILVATTLLLILLFLSAAVLLYRINRIQNKYSISLQSSSVASNSEDIYSDLLQWQTHLHSRSADAVNGFLDNNLDQIAKVRQSLEALSTLLTSQNQESPSQENPDVKNEKVPSPASSHS
ncbi:unnamed protein product [Ceutorhynchus assimilis]|uniref:GRAM domain-containing protein n=1 Tax=Ceutorhynchus assimilis TaxID=467358 RepID=A0A9N9MWJ6_9CUCU|nr:unnamed protein product [Ceutorhynchus assimilis]